LRFCRIKRGRRNSPHPAIAGVFEFMRLDEVLVGSGRRTKALRQIEHKLAFRLGAHIEIDQQTRI
jgi:hypothetical protein